MNAVAFTVVYAESTVTFRQGEVGQERIVELPWRANERTIVQGRAYVAFNLYNRCGQHY